MVAAAAVVPDDSTALPAAIVKMIPTLDFFSADLTRRVPPWFSLDPQAWLCCRRC
jgi:hypothetical protein